MFQFINYEAENILEIQIRQYFFNKGFQVVIWIYIYLYLNSYFSILIFKVSVYVKFQEKKKKEDFDFFGFRNFQKVDFLGEVVLVGFLSFCIVFLD